MSTVTSPRSASLTPITSRFLWKEYRTLRGMWLAVLGLGGVVQALLVLFAAPNADVPSITFGTALATTVLYAVGASAVLFAVEHEDETYGFLTGLPATWVPLYVGKLSVALGTSFALAAALIVTGAVIAGGRLPSATNAQLNLGLFGVGIFEAIVWGTLFSLLMKRPIAAVLCAIAVGSVAVHFAVNYAAPNGTAALNLQSYATAIPYRLMIVFAVLACSALVARRWLIIGNRPLPGGVAQRIPFRPSAWIANVTQVFSRSTGRDSAPAQSLSRRGTLTRLLWHAWRENWKMLLMPFAVAIFLYVAVIALGGTIIGTEFATVVCAAIAFLLPTLYGAMAFGADQRRGKYRFLAEHAASPRYVWLSRHVVWLGSLVGISLIVAVAASLAGVLTLHYTTGQRISYDFYRGYESTTTSARQLHVLLNLLLLCSVLSSLGALTAYALGQICSMLLRSEILAAFLAVVLSVVLSAWVAVIWVWELEPLLCLLPLFAGFMLATWLRAPDWLTDRKSLRSWWKPAVAIVAPIALLALFLPEMRRLPALPRESIGMPIRLNAGHYSRGNTPAARETAKMYEKAAQLWTEAQGSDILHRWQQRKYYGEDKFGNSRIDESKMTMMEQIEYRQALQEQQEKLNRARQQVNDIIIEGSRRPSCRFDVDWSAEPTALSDVGVNNKQREAWATVFSQFLGVLQLIQNVPFEDLPPAEAVEFQLAGLRMLDHLRQGQPTDVANGVLGVEMSFLERIVGWASRDSVPTEQLQEFLKDLQNYFADNPIDPKATFDTDASIVRRVLVGEIPPATLAAHPENQVIYLAFLANELPWERERALKALDQITLENQGEAAELARFIYGRQEQPFANQYLQRWIRNEGEGAEPWTENLPSAATSYLAALEYKTRVSVRKWFQRVLEAETYRRATLLRLALILYHREHGEYPSQLSELTPKFLKELPPDPFTGNNQPFSYLPAGLDLPLTQYANSSVTEIAPRTPLLWSAGPSNVRLKRTQHDTSVPGEKDPSEITTIMKVYYILESDDYGWYSFGTPLVFPLPNEPTVKLGPDQA